MPDILAKLRNPGYRATVSEGQLREDLAQLKSLPLDELLSFVDEMAGELKAMVNRLPELILIGLDNQLATHEPSKSLAATAIQKAMRR